MSSSVQTPCDACGRDDTLDAETGDDGDEAERARQRRHCSIGTGWRGEGNLEAVFDPISWQIFEEELHRVGEALRLRDERDGTVRTPSAASPRRPRRDGDAGCDVDHIIPRSAGGTTCYCNGRLLCPAHNRIPALRNPKRQRNVVTPLTDDDYDDRSTWSTTDPPAERPNSPDHLRSPADRPSTPERSVRGGARMSAMPERVVNQPITGGPLAGVRVIDAATLFAGPLAATFLGDFGAEVVKVEHPAKPDAARTHGPSKDGVGLWWKTLGRNKRTITINLSRPQGADLLLRLATRSDVLIENFRPGTLERWGIGPAELHAANPRLVIARVTAFGQFGPMARQPGFGSIAEAMSGFAAITGEPNGPPTLPPFGLADGIAALATSFAVTAALRTAEATGRGQMVDVAIIEPIMMMLGAQITTFDQLGTVQQRLGNRSVNNAPRNVYLTGDGDWVAVSTSSQSIAERVLRLVRRPDDDRGAMVRHRSRQGTTRRRARRRCR